MGVKELIRDGYLCALISKAGAHKADTESLGRRGGEFIASEAEAMMDDDVLVKAACREIANYTRDRKSCLIFATGVAHAQHIRDILEQHHQTKCGFVCGETPVAERDATLQAFKAGKLRYLVNVNVLTTGFDAPNIDCVALLRPTLSPGLYYQMVGRGFRLHPGKANCLILDYGNNVIRHGPVDQIEVKPVNRTGKGGEAPAKECEECAALVAAGYAICPECGHTFPEPEGNKHDATASTAGILSGQCEDAIWDVERVRYSVHTKKGGEQTAPKTRQVEFSNVTSAYAAKVI